MFPVRKKNSFEIAYFYLAKRRAYQILKLTISYSAWLLHI